MTDATIVSYEQLASMPAEDVEMVCMVIGYRGDLFRRRADEAAMAWRLARARHPGTPITVSISGYDDDPRELWEFREVRRYIKYWAHKTGLDSDPYTAAMAAVPPSSRTGKTAGLLDQLRQDFAALLSVCGVFGPEIQATVKRPTPVTAH